MRKQSSYNCTMKILLIGNSGSGKSSLIMRYIEDKFMLNFYNTIGVDYKIKMLDLDDNKIKMQIWDTAGQDRFKNITSSYYRGADGILILFDITDGSSFEGVQNWLNEIDKYVDENIEKILIGNKCDLSERRAIPASQADSFAKSLRLDYIETSARDGTNVQQAFRQIARKVIAARSGLNRLKEVAVPQKLSARNNEKKKDEGCC